METIALPEERRQHILTRLNTDGRIEVPEIAKQFDTSVETIRKDLIELEKRGLLKRVHGGALPLNQHPSPLGDQSDGPTDTQRRIGVAAAARLTNGGSVLIDAGTTTQAVVEAIKTPTDTVFITNSLRAAAHLASVATTHFLGGVINAATLGTHGAKTVDQLYALRPDWVVLGADAIDPDYGCSSSDPEIAEVKRNMVSQATQVMVVVEGSKFTTPALVHFAPIDHVDVLITSKDLPQDVRDALAEYDCEVIYT
ncbi:DeoR/GlpR family DNA-binding transcription regulator [Stomatohabitans albus]|uniref:DeoR/GlpR family DNA-binding transcription regulator n=1 Tax=Stomatohabitans albus TaxID=3110766 RepID=UPI00300D035E